MESSILQSITSIIKPLPERWQRKARGNNYSCCNSGKTNNLPLLTISSASMDDEVPPYRNPKTPLGMKLKRSSALLDGRKRKHQIILMKNIHPSIHVHNKKEKGKRKEGRKKEKNEEKKKKKAQLSIHLKPPHMHNHTTNKMVQIIKSIDNTTQTCFFHTFLAFCECPRSPE